MNLTSRKRLTLWFEREQNENGLIDFKFFLNPESGAPIEDICTEILAMLKAQAIEDPDLF